MRLLADRCVDRRVAGALRSDGHDVLALAETSLNPPDREILASAVIELRVVLTEDVDFGTHVFRDRLGSAGVIRIAQTAWREQAASVRMILRRHADELEQGAFVTDRRDRVRVTWPT